MRIGFVISDGSITDVNHDRRRPSSAGSVEQPPSIEDGRGVDVSQIRRQLRMSVEDRVRNMVEVSNTLMNVRATARVVDPPKVR